MTGARPYSDARRRATAVQPDDGVVDGLARLDARRRGRSRTASVRA